MGKCLSFIGKDTKLRPVYRDECGTLWKDISFGYSMFSNKCLCSCGDSIEGEPTEPMGAEYMVAFVPGRVPAY